MKKMGSPDQPKFATMATKPNNANEASTSSPPMSQILHICYIDNNHISSQAIYASLTAKGHEVDHYASIEKAYEILLEIDYDLVLISQTATAGEFDCKALTHLLRNAEEPAKRALPIVAIAVNAHASNLRSLREAGIDEIAVKPFQKDLSELLLNVFAYCNALPFTQSALPALKVCFLEDSYSLSRTLCELLEDNGHEVDHFTSNEEALDAVLEKNYDLLLASQNDVQGGFDCAGLLRMIRASNDLQKRRLPIVVLTSNQQPENLKTLNAAGANRIIAKKGPNLKSQVLDALRITEAPKKTRASSPPPVPAAPEKTAAPKNEVFVQEKQPVPSHTTSPKDNSTNQIDELLMEPESYSEPIIIQPDLGHPQEPEQQFQIQPNHQEPFKRNHVAIQHPAAKQSENAWRRTAYGLAIVAVLAGLATVGWNFFVTGIPVEVVAARLGSLQKTVHGEGTIASKKQVDLTAAVGGQLTEVLVATGETVKKGTVLAKLDHREAAMKIKQAEAQLASAKEEVALAESAYEDLMSNTTSPTEGTNSSSSIEASISAAKARQVVAATELRAAKLALERLSITAPFAGLITQSTAVEGLWVQPPAPIFTLVDVQQREIAIRVSATDAKDISIGQKVTVSSDAFPGLEWNEEITHLTRDKETTGEQSGEDIVVFASLSDEAPPLEFGQAVQAQIITKTTRNVVKLPIEAIQKRDSGFVAATVSNKTVQFNDVELGLRALTEVEIVSGVDAHQQVILPRKNLVEGQRVEPIVTLQYAVEEEGYPHRKDYPTVAVYTTEQLRRNYNDVHIVDVRAKFEYDVVHVTKAINIPVSSKEFTKKLEALRPKNDTTPIVFYCNGHSCSKSYEAARRAIEEGFKYVYAYDSGILDWMAVSQDKTTLLGKTPAPADKMVSEAYFQSRLVDFSSFSTKAQAKESIVIDIRDDMQKATNITIPTVQLPLDQFITKLNAGQFKDKQLLIFDAVGKQVRWLQYILEDQGYKDYFFLRDGIASADGQ